jgi:hypothetical protein
VTFAERSAERELHAREKSSVDYASFVCARRVSRAACCVRVARRSFAEPRFLCARPLFASVAAAAAAAVRGSARRCLPLADTQNQEC